MEQPKFGYNLTQSFVEFKTTNGFARLGIEGSQIFLERYDFGAGSPSSKVYLTNNLNEISAIINNEVFRESSGGDIGISLPYTKRIFISKADILGMFATPIIIVPAIAGVIHEFCSGLLMYNRVTATYGGGGDVTIRNGDNTILSATITAANSFGAAANVFRTFGRLNAAGGYILPPEKNLRIQNATAAFTDPGTAVGTAWLDVNIISHIVPF